MTLVKLRQLHKRAVLNGVDLTINEHEHIGLKMTHDESVTLFRLIMGRELPSSGTVERDSDITVQQLADDGLYESLTVIHYLKFFKRLVAANCDLQKVLQICSLQDLSTKKIKRLTVEQKQRVSLARLCIEQPTLALIENPLGQNPSDEGIELYLRGLHALQQMGIATLVTSYFLEELILLSDVIYQYNKHDGLVKTDVASDADTTTNSESSPSSPRPQAIFKVASKLEDKTIFFSPNEIDYVESVNGISNLRIGDESFPSTLTMNELEAKLINFGFFRCHRSYLVNLQRIAELTSYTKNSYTLILKGQTKAGIPLSRTKVDEIRALLDF